MSHTKLTPNASAGMTNRFEAQLKLGDTAAPETAASKGTELSWITRIVNA